jgi:hypothetical protein
MFLEFFPLKTCLKRRNTPQTRLEKAIRAQRISPTWNSQKSANIDSKKGKSEFLHRDDILAPVTRSVPVCCTTSGPSEARRWKEAEPAESGEG